MSEKIKSMSAQICTTERNAAISEFRKGGKWITDGTTIKYLKAGCPLPDGFSYGKSKKK